MASGVDRDLLAESITRARTSDEVWIEFVTGAIRGPSFQQLLIDRGGVEAGRVWGKIVRLAEVGVGAVYERAALRLCKYPFDFRSASAEYQLGRGGEWRILRNGRLYKTDPKRIGEPTVWEEPTPFDALDVAERMTITEAADQDTIVGNCKRFIGNANSTGVRAPEIWETSEPLAVEVLVDLYGMLRRIEIEVTTTRGRRATTLTLEYRTHRVPAQPAQQP